MAKGLEKHRDRLNALSLFGKNLARRSNSKCELCSASGVKLSIYEVPLAPKDPEYDKCAFLCDTCITDLNNPEKLNPHHWRCLGDAIWSEQTTTQVLSFRLLKKLSDHHSWASDILEEIYLDEAVEIWANNVTF